MNYSALIQNRKSAREFSAKPVSSSVLAEIESYYQNSCKRLIPELQTKLCIFGKEAQAALEGTAGYENYLIGSPNYLVLLSFKDRLADINAGYMMEDLVLKLTDMDLACCWVTFTESKRIKMALKIDSDLDVAAIVAFGNEVKAPKRLRLNILSMSNVDVKAKRHYFDPKKNMSDMVFMDKWGNTAGVEDFIGFYDDMLWEAFYAASLTPSYLNRQPYGFIIHDNTVTLVKMPDSYTPPIDEALGLGIVMLHFAAVLSVWFPQLKWNLDENASRLSLPEGYEAIASCSL